MATGICETLLEAYKARVSGVHPVSNHESVSWWFNLAHQIECSSKLDAMVETIIGMRESMGQDDEDDDDTFELELE